MQGREVRNIIIIITIETSPYFSIETSPYFSSSASLSILISCVILIFHYFFVYTSSSSFIPIASGVDSQESSLKQVLEMQKEKIEELERTIKSNNYRTYDEINQGNDGMLLVDGNINNSSESSSNGNENGRNIPENVLENDLEKNFLSARIEELESLLLSSDTEVILLQNILIEKDKEIIENNEKHLLNINNTNNTNINFNNTTTSNISNNTNQSNRSNNSNTDFENTDFDMDNIYPDNDQTPFGGINPLGVKRSKGEHDRDSGA